MAKNSCPDSNARTPAARARRESYWRKMVSRWKASGLSKAEFCKDEDLSYARIIWWIRELEKRKPPRARKKAPKEKSPSKIPLPNFVPVQVADSKPVMTGNQGVELEVGGRIIRVAPGFHPDTLRQVVSVLENSSC